MNIKKLLNLESCNKIELTIQILFYLLVILYFVGKVFKPITFIIDALFIYQIVKSKDSLYFKELFEKYKILIYSFTAFGIYLLFQSIFLEYKYYTFKSSFETIMYLILVFAAIYNFNTKEKIRNLIYASYLILFFLALDSFYQYFTGTDFFGKEMYGGGRRITAWHDSAKVNLMMGQFFGLLIASIFIFDIRLKKIAIIILIISSVLFILAGNRSPILALFSSLILIFLFIKNKKIIIYMISLFIIVFAISFSNPKLNKAYTQLLNPTSNSNTSGRLVIFDVGLEMLKDNTILGIGTHNYKHYFREYFDKIDQEKHQARYIKILKELTPTHVHSVGLDIIISYGILGTMIFTYMLLQIYKHFIKDNEIGLLASIGFVYCITPFQFGRSFTMGDWQFITYLGLIFLIIMSNYKKLDYNEA